MSTNSEMWLRLTVLIVLGISIGIAQDEPACKTNNNCACCKSNPDGRDRDLWDICNNQRWNWKCTYGCIDGYWGNKCFNYCPNTCITCDRNYGGNKICNSCKDGYYGTICGAHCPSNCAQNKCDQTTGNCLHGCINNWVGNKCNICADTWYGNNCDIQCPVYCKNRICDRNGDCTSGCADEKLEGLQCNRCKYGKYGDNCDKDCPVNCNGNVCNKDNGVCTYNCTGNFAGDKCDICKPGYYGENCNNQCLNCLNGMCDRSTGTCIDCANGKFGEQCDKSCSSGCKNSVCDRITAVCSQECWNIYSGDKCCVESQGCEICDTTMSCSKCKSGYHGNACGRSCPNCDGACDKDTGNCEACKDDKYYGDQCRTPCPPNCLNGQCAKTDGQCDSCETGFYGDQCMISCPMNCLNDQCAEEDGQCISCELGYFGNMCKDKCPENCLNRECGREHGECPSCDIGFYGNICNETCPTNCEGNICDQHDGICQNCTVGFYGNECNNPCRKDCINGTCIQDSGVCVYGCINGCEEVIEPSSPPSPLGAAVGGSIGGLVAIAFVIVGVWFVLKKRRLQQEANNRYITDEPISDIKPAIVNNGVYENCNSVTTRETKSAAPKVVPKQKEDFHNVALEESHEPDNEENEVDDDYYTFRNVIKVADLQAYVKQNVGNYLSNEFKRLAKGLKQPCRFATRSENIALNRYNGLYPYDHSRVKLPHDKKFFINACYINGNHQQKAYIASLGPTKVTTDNFATFWKMVWYEKSDIIVMLTNLQEPSGMKCQQYWPDRGQSLTFHDLEIKCDSIEDFSEYTLRTFTVFKGKERRTVSQLHFTAWPDKSVPNNVTSLVEFRQRVKSTYTLSQGPVIVHCSAGIGRTGTYIAIDLLTEEGLNKGHVDVFGCIRNMREQRVNMVQTPDQYEYVHRAIVYTLIFDVDYTPTETFNEYVMSLTDSQYAALHKKLSISIETVNKEHEKAVSINKTYKEKNRSISDVPDNSSRPMLYLNRAFNDANYINAVYVDGFKRKNRFILAQTPLSSTLDDFVCLLYQEKCSCIVSVEIADAQKHDVGCYIPEEKESLTFGSFVVTCMKYQNKYNHQYRQLKITNNGKQSTGERIVHHYQYTNWKNNEKVPSSDADFVQFIKDTQSTVQEDGQAPMILHCLTGGKKCGLFCTVSLLLERADIIRQISVVNTVRLLRLRRPNVIPNKEQLQFAHQCVASQMEMLSTYTNFSM